MDLPGDVSDVVLVAIVTAVGSIVVAVVSRSNGHAKRAAVAASRSARDAAAARVQVENNHTTNLREEGDERHTENVVNFGRVLDALTETRKDIGGLRSETRALRGDVSKLYGRTDEQAADIDVLKDTIPKGPPAWPSTPAPTPPTPETGPSAPSSGDSPWT